ncbi:uncharacterized protein LOC122089851 [Macadamia integrifolia]|uniref:uncharacterized protein LOC122089851 n=1 Tax=Macadamia integrifolia TaxID=60698 RepID=UPI001C4EB272|nr:uncharacterized protein LOC122089851 [Macadamia integrifolia]XP_042515507.1 uncharacterized protein LOC122089851 [Macadamia integrifolia]
MDEGERVSGESDLGDHDGRPPDRGRQSLLTDFWQKKEVSSARIGSAPPPPPLQEDGLEAVAHEKKASYSTIVGGGIPDVDTLPDPFQVGSLTTVIIPQEVYEERLGTFRFALIRRTNFRFVSLDDICQEVKNTWTLKGRIAFAPMSKGFFLLQFEIEADMIMIWKRNIVKVGTQTIRFQRWKRDFNVHEKQAVTKMVWIRFPDLPMEYWHEKILLTMAKAAGRPMAIDRRTRVATMGGYARLW